MLSTTSSPAILDMIRIAHKVCRDVGFEPPGKWNIRELYEFLHECGLEREAMIVGEWLQDED